MTDFQHSIDPVLIDNKSSGRRYPAAVKSWFSSTGSVIPLSFKFMGDDGVLRSINSVELISSNEEDSSGIKSLNFTCSSLIAGLKFKYLLSFYPDLNRWVFTAP